MNTNTVMVLALVAVGFLAYQAMKGQREAVQTASRPNSGTSLQLGFGFTRA